MMRTVATSTPTTLLSCVILTVLFLTVLAPWSSVDASTIMTWSSVGGSHPMSRRYNSRMISSSSYYPNSLFGRRLRSSRILHPNTDMVASSSSSSSRRRHGGTSDCISETILVKRTATTQAAVVDEKRGSSSRSSSKITEEDRQMSYEEMRAQLGPVGSLIANSVELAIVTVGSYISGAMFGYVIGGVMGVPTLMEKNSATKMADQIKQRIQNWNHKAFTQAKSWGQLSAAFSGFGAFTKICRGNSDDKWNSIIGSALTGAYLSRQGGTQAMIQGASTYAGFTYLIDSFFAGPKNQNAVEKDFDFKDTPVAVEERGF